MSKFHPIFHLKLLYTIQLISFLIIGTFFVHVLYTASNLSKQNCRKLIKNRLQLRSSRIALTSTANAKLSTDVNDAENEVWMRYDRVKGKEKKTRHIRHAEDLNRTISRRNPTDSSLADEFIWLGPNARVQKTVIAQFCWRVHVHCAEKGLKLRGAPGLRGASGVEGPPGPPGVRGVIGPPGLPGMIGEVGPTGEAGRDGICNCTFPDVVIKTVPIPTTPEIRTVEVTRLVPGPPDIVTVTVLVPGPPGPPKKEVTTEILPPPSTTGRPAPPWTTTITTSITTTPEITSIKTTSTERSTTTTTIGEPYTGPPTLASRSIQTCELELVGKTNEHARFETRPFGSWMIDSAPPNANFVGKRWVMDSLATEVLKEYKNEKDLRDHQRSTIYYLDYIAVGSGSVIYNGSLYYHQIGSPNIIRYDLTIANKTHQTRLSRLAFKDCPRTRHHLREVDPFLNCSEHDRSPYLYNIKHNFVDFAVDENGLWVVYLDNGNVDRLVVEKLEDWDLYSVATWTINLTEIYGFNIQTDDMPFARDSPFNLDDDDDENGNGNDHEEEQEQQQQQENITTTLPPLKRRTLANTFIICGILYGVDTHGANAKINFAYDLYNNQEIVINTPWFNPEGSLTMLDYNKDDRRLYFYDGGGLYSTPVRARRDRPFGT